MDERKNIFLDYARHWNQRTSGANAAQLISQTANMFDQYYPDRKWGALLRDLRKEVSPVSTTRNIHIQSQYLDEYGLAVVRSMLCVVLAELDHGF